MAEIYKWNKGMNNRFSSCHVKHLRGFSHKIIDVNFQSVKMLSLDVVSLFIQIPVDGLLSFLEERLLKFQDQLPLSVTKIVDLIRLCVSTR